MRFKDVFYITRKIYNLSKESCLKHKEMRIKYCLENKCFKYNHNLKTVPFTACARQHHFSKSRYLDITEKTLQD